MVWGIYTPANYIDCTANHVINRRFNVKLQDGHIRTTEFDYQ